MQRSAAYPAAGMRRVRQRRDQREQYRRATYRERRPPLPATHLTSARVRQQPGPGTDAGSR